MSPEGGTRLADASDGQSARGGDPLIDGVADWLMERAIADTPMEALLEGTCDRLVAAGIPLVRGYVGFRTLHPLFVATTITWARGAPVRTESIPHDEGERQGWRDSPHSWMVDRVVPQLRRRLTGPHAQLDFPLLTAFRDAGGTDYLAYAIAFVDTQPGEVPRSGLLGSWLTDRPTGFTDAEIRALVRIQQRLIVACKMTIQNQIANNILAAYLGDKAGAQVLAGHIRLGDGQSIHAVIWYNDLRDSTPMADSMAAADFLRTLNDYFQCTAGSVLAHGGEVLRFVGDAVLAIFPIEDDGDDEPAACAKAMAAATESRDRLAALNAGRGARGEGPIDFGLGLHLGDVMFGNIGVADRVEFSVIGPAANEVARVEGLTKELGHPVLASAAVARHTPDRWRSLGLQHLRGVARDIEVFAPAGEGTAP